MEGVEEMPMVRYPHPHPHPQIKCFRFAVKRDGGDRDSCGEDVMDPVL